jgi:flagellar basal-body rod protein FlgB
MPDKNMMVLEKMIDLSVFRQKLLASNIANADTPGYKAKDIAFQAELNKAIEGGSGAYKIHETYSSMPNRDGNSVNLDVEMAKMTENALIHNAATQILSMKVRMMKNALKGTI